MNNSRLRQRKRAVNDWSDIHSFMTELVINTDRHLNWKHFTFQFKSVHIWIKKPTQVFFTINSTQEYLQFNSDFFENPISTGIDFFNHNRQKTHEKKNWWPIKKLSFQSSSNDNRFKVFIHSTFNSFHFFLSSYYTAHTWTHPITVYSHSLSQRRKIFQKSKR